MILRRFRGGLGSIWGGFSVLNSRGGPQTTEMTQSGRRMGRCNHRVRPRAARAGLSCHVRGSPRCHWRAAAEVAVGAAAGGMAGFGVANERLRALEELEREIGASLQSAGGWGLRRWAGLTMRGAGRGGRGRGGGGCGARGGTSGLGWAGLSLPW